jgi:hypothetical protein
MPRIVWSAHLLSRSWRHSKDAQPHNPVAPSWLRRGRPYRGWSCERRQTKAPPPESWHTRFGGAFVFSRRSPELHPVEGRRGFFVGHRSSFADVRLAAHNGLYSDIAPCLKCANSGNRPSAHPASSAPISGALRATSKEAVGRQASLW